MNFPRKKNESNTEYSRRVITAGMSVIVRVDSKCSQIIDGYNY